jgi:hypothetical protein
MIYPSLAIIGLSIQKEAQAMIQGIVDYSPDDSNQSTQLIPLGMKTRAYGITLSNESSG